VSVPWKPYRPSLMFVVEARSRHESGATERCFARVSSGLIHNHWARLEMLTGDKHSSLLRTFINNGRKKVYNNGATAVQTSAVVTRAKLGEAKARVD